jgi:Tat protein translocase TatB subunit
MDFLGVGPLELIVVLIIAFIVVGPERLPQLAQSIGKTLRDVRAMSQGLATEWQREIDAVAKVDTGEGLQQTLRELRQTQSDLKQALNAPLTSPSGAKAQLPPPEESSPEQPIPEDNEADHANT